MTPDVTTLNELNKDFYFLHTTQPNGFVELIRGQSVVLSQFIEELALRYEKSIPLTSHINPLMPTAFWLVLSLPFICKFMQIICK